MNYLELTIKKIEEQVSSIELKKIADVVIHMTALEAWSEKESSVLLARIEEQRNSLTCK